MLPLPGSAKTLPASKWQALTRTCAACCMESWCSWYCARRGPSVEGGCSGEAAKGFGGGAVFSCRRSSSCSAFAQLPASHYRRRSHSMLLST
jgi:hypothetical protein